MKAFQPNAPLKKRGELEQLLHALEYNGPINFHKNQVRVWINGYKTFGRVQTIPTAPGLHSSSIGALMGTEYRALKDKYTVGLLLGCVVGRQTQKVLPDTHTKSKGVNYGVYGSYSFLDGARVDAVITNLQINLKHQRYDVPSGSLALAKYKMNTLIADGMASYLWKLPDDYSIRVNLGNTFVGNKAGRYTETGAGAFNATQHSSSSFTNEVYGGLGLRKGWMVDGILYRLTTSYEIGRQYMKKGKPIQVSYFGSNPVTINSGPMRVNHYLNANFSVLKEDISLKGIVAYNATISPKVSTYGKSIRQMVSLKFEYRF